MNIRQEDCKDYEAVFKLVEDAFRDEPYTDHQEQFLVERLRKAESFVPESSLVAEIDHQIVGYILLTKIKIVSDRHVETPALALAPVAVLKEYRGKGIGGRLIREAHRRAKSLNFDAIVLLGHSSYYPKFGYQPIAKYGIRLPFDAHEENCMLIELKDNAMLNVSGLVEYPKEFFER